MIATHTAISGASGTSSASAPGEHHDARERGDEQRARDVATDDLVDEPAHAVGVGRRRAGTSRRTPPTRNSPSSTIVIASRIVNSAAATPSATAPAAFSIGFEFALRCFGASSSHCCTFSDALASRSRGPTIGSVAEVLHGLRDLLVEVADLVDRRHGDQRGEHRRTMSAVVDEHDAGRGAAVPTGAALQRLDQRDSARTPRARRSRAPRACAGSSG